MEPIQIIAKREPIEIIDNTVEEVAEADYEINVFDTEKEAKKRHYFGVESDDSDSIDEMSNDEDYIAPEKKKRGRKPKTATQLALNKPTRPELDPAKITEERRAILQKQFDFCPYLVSTELRWLSLQTGLDEADVKLWFQQERREYKKQHGKLKMTSREAELLKSPCYKCGKLTVRSNLDKHEHKFHRWNFETTLWY